MDIYYKRKQTWYKYPNNDQIESDIVYYSKSKRRFEDHIIVGVDPQLTFKDRLKKVAAVLRIRPSKIKLIRA